MLVAVIHTLIALCVLVLAIHLILWVIQSLGISIPDQVVKILWVIAALVAILIILQTLLPGLGLRMVSVLGSTLLT